MMFFLFWGVQRSKFMFPFMFFAALVEILHEKGQIFSWQTHFSSLYGDDGILDILSVQDKPVPLEEAEGIWAGLLPLPLEATTMVFNPKLFSSMCQYLCQWLLAKVIFGESFECMLIETYEAK